MYVGEQRQQRTSAGGSKVRFLGALVAAVILVAFAVILTGTDSAAASTTTTRSSRITTITLASPTYRPHAAPGTTDDYHCTS